MDEMKPSLPDDCDVPDDALQEYIALGWKSLLINRSLHMDRDEAFHKSETAKWDAIGKYGEKLVVASHAAKQLLPFTPNRESNQPRRRKNPARGEADDRVRDLLMGGTGGWISKVLDDEDWTPIDHRKYGVPDEGESESDSESIKQKLKESWDKMIEERDARLKGTAIFKHASEGEKLDGTDLYLASDQGHPGQATLQAVCNAYCINPLIPSYNKPMQAIVRQC
ncbi:uncharacterized protein I303_105218 [Kwoniella dejecticola CBS 10117]|uniref:Uncharacterized protein n=1 Tax=Kwoniella dejecticola CBS 10117 TaxID=1296121 RepID=A0A1A6A342_9TREE|nr:uncharacterized protein I303_05335 [Kwoniella dejecticola CBS 10117]OBR84477.1 hypothetical protein I303_05335 [Kwoniella dejecticola CBS 10117]